MHGDAYSVWGVTHDLRSRVHRPEVNGKKISIVGYIVSRGDLLKVHLRPDDEIQAISPFALQERNELIQNMGLGETTPTFDTAISEDPHVAVITAQPGVDRTTQTDLEHFLASL